MWTADFCQYVGYFCGGPCPLDPYPTLIAVYECTDGQGNIYYQYQEQGCTMFC